MSDVTLLRKLTRKSTLKFGIHSDLSVQEMINLKKHKYLRWVYFNCSNIDFMEDVLDEIKIPSDFRIPKPSKKTELHFELNKFIFDSCSEEFQQKILKKTEKIAKKTVKAISICKIKQHENKYKKDYLRRKNQGNNLS
jgi:hypothetical protein